MDDALSKSAEGSIMGGHEVVTNLKVELEEMREKLEGEIRSAKYKGKAKAWLQVCRPWTLLTFLRCVQG